jgi:hypothetical protein
VNVIAIGYEQSIEFKVTFRILLILMLICSALPFAEGASAQEADTVHFQKVTPIVLQGRHSLTFGVGLLPDAEISPGNVSANGFLGSFSYAYWPYEEWGLETSVSLLNSELSGGNAASISTILFGASYYPEFLALGSFARPYISGAAGPYIGTETGNSFQGAGPDIQTVIGVRLGIGADAYAWNWLRLGLLAAYHLTPEFDDALGIIQSGSGAQLSLELGLSFGGE